MREYTKVLDKNLQEMNAVQSDLSKKSVLIGEFPRFISKKEFYLRCFMLFAKLGTILLFAKQIYMLLNIFFSFQNLVFYTAIPNCCEQ